MSEWKTTEDKYTGYWMDATKGIPLPGVPLIVTIWDSIHNKRELRYPVYYRKGNFDNEFNYYLYGNEDYQLTDEYSKVLAWSLLPEVWEGDVDDKS